MIRVQFFARYREMLGRAEDSLAWAPELATVGDLREHLVQRGGSWAEELCGLAEPLRDGDEVAFFPTVTGG